MRRLPKFKNSIQMPECKPPLIKESKLHFLLIKSNVMDDHDARIKLWNEVVAMLDKSNVVVIPIGYTAEVVVVDGYTIQLEE